MMVRPDQMCPTYRMTTNFGGKLNLANWRFITKPPKFNFANILKNCCLHVRAELQLLILSNIEKHVLVVQVFEHDGDVKIR